MNCPHCESSDTEQTGKFDLTVVDARECRHDFECCDCGALFQIIYAPVRTIVIERPEVELV
jgi:transcription elongation factor Elf1